MGACSLIDKTNEEFATVLVEGRIAVGVGVGSTGICKSMLAAAGAITSSLTASTTGSIHGSFRR